MNIFDQAMELEKEGEALYREFSLESPNQGMRNIFSWLSDQERKHYEIFEKMKKGKPASVAKSTILHDVKDIFDDWKDNTKCIDIKTTQADVYRRALAIEIKSIMVYEKYASAAPASQKEIFLKIAKEEKGHKRIVESIIEFIIKPEVWAENAEFSHLGEDYYL
ncbi:MAG: ferritin family protein [Candidatus Omnitrophota bacterium]